MSGFLETATLHRFTAASDDALGNPAKSFDDVPLTVAAWPTVYSEVDAGQDVVTQGIDLMAFNPVNVSALDEITYRGKRYPLRGDSGMMHSPLTGREITVLHLLRRT